MYTYAILDENGVVENIAVYEDLIPDTSTLVNIDKMPWISIGRSIDDTSLKVTANEIIDRRMRWLDQLFERIERKQFRPVCNLLRAQRTMQASDPEDEEIFEQCEREKAALRSLYPITDASGEDIDWQRGVMLHLRKSLKFL